MKAVFAMVLCCAATLSGFASVRAADVAPSKAGESEHYLLCYKFHAGDTLRWNVIHRCQIRTSVTTSTQTAETTTSSIKAWRVHEVKPDGTIIFDHLVESVDMRHRLSGRDEVHYDSRKQLHAPQGFEDVARAVGVPLAVVTINPQGKVLDRKQNMVKAAVAGQGDITIPLPDEPITVGHRWSFPHAIDLPLPDGTTRRIRSTQTYTLESVKTGVATIAMTTQILTPLNDPSIEALLLQYETAGQVRFDIDNGRILGRQADVDKSVVGFRGQASSIHYVARSTEEFLPSEGHVAMQGSSVR